MKPDPITLARLRANQPTSFEKRLGYQPRALPNAAKPRQQWAAPSYDSTRNARANPNRSYQFEPRRWIKVW